MVGMNDSELKYSENIGWIPFEQHAEKYDAWFDSERGRGIFDLETGCIKRLLEGTPQPWLEIGVGTGRFAEALGVREGIDPSRSVLKYASKRGIKTNVGTAEKLPYGDSVFGLTLMVVTICFLEDPVKALTECRRVLKKDGFVVLGLVPKDVPWGVVYAKKGAEGHPFYSCARFYTTDEVIKMAEEAGFGFDRAVSCLFEDPDRHVKEYASPREGIVKNAGFVGMRFGPTR